MKIIAKKQFMENTRAGFRSLSGVFIICALFIIGIQPIWAQNDKIEITGTILLGDDGSPAIGATVQESGNATNGTISDIDGKFVLRVQPNSNIEISFVGYDNQTISVKGRKELSIVLNVKTFDFDNEVVVVGYGTQKRVNLTGAVSTVSTKELENRPIASIAEALQGTTPGLTIQQYNSQPGSRLSINVRGVNTLNDNTPLIIIDGIISDIQNVNPADVENISVLKDASSTAIYGSRASNGVVLITTKRGRAGKAEISYDFNYGIQEATAMPNVVKSWEYAELRNEAMRNSGRPAPFSNEQILNYKQNGPNSNWMKDIYRTTAPIQNHNLSVRGGGTDTQYLASFGYMDHSSMLEGPSYGHQRYNMRLNVNTKISDRLSFDASIAYVRNEIRDHAYWTEWLIEQSSRMPPIYSIKKEDGSYNYPAGSNSNALQRLEEGGYRKNQDDDLTGVLNAEYKIIDGLKLSGMAAGQIVNSRVHENRKAIIFEGSGDQENRMTENSGRTQNLSTNIILSYDKTFAEAHNLKAMLGYSYEGGWNDSFQTYRITEDSENDMMGGSQTDKVGNQGWRNEWSIYSGFMRLNYNFNERYLFEFNLRDDVSSKFRKGNRSGWFPSLSAAWRISEEKFYSESLKNILSSVKLRSSWGLVGNNRIEDYLYQATVSVYNGYNFGDKVVNVANYGSANSDLKWETTSMFDVGVDLGFLNNALTFTADFFNNTTNDILIGIPMPGIYGGGSPVQNAGKVRNRGWEISARYNLSTGAFKHSLSGSLSDSQNKVLDTKGTEWISGHDITTIVREGYPINSYYAYRWDGFFQNEEEVRKGPHLAGITPKPGDIRYLSKNGDKVVTEDDDRYILGNSFPRFLYGFNYNLEWNGFDFSMFWQGVGQRRVWIRGEAVEAFHNNNEGPVFDFHMDRWTPSNPDATYPRLTVGTESQNNAAKSDFWIQDAAYLRLKNVQLGYTLPASLTKKMMISKLRVYGSVQNALTFDNMKGGYDPETAGGRTYPVARVYSIGLNLRF
ncbi:TonB-dependent receptor [Dysgonomonas sp. Marseille-P4677]|uniref:SusC/RagA family TonB-linked outer membrane protein n=1 Tax=Dysgonomonas sp. Marseille-P4677 TaxID=2364790 RepID=UPI001911DF9D|nr:TonB-dependent receptor [Dysgonomonas sp. Marseille-P4677]MBK5720810.1 TonB-dependent receptor [Dysgonomonas sp. Marseille-P4677]